MARRGTCHDPNRPNRPPPPTLDVPHANCEDKLLYQIQRQARETSNTKTSDFISYHHL